MRYPYALALELDGPRAAASLTAAERRVCSALPGAARRRDWRAGRIAAKRAAALLGAAAAPVTVSLAHVAGRAAAVAAPGRVRLGVDLERAGAVHPDHARYFLTAVERRLARRLTLTTLWALKEAAWKALALNPATPFTALQLHADRGGGRVVTVSLRRKRWPARVWLARPWRGFVLAVVWLGEAW